MPNLLSTLFRRKGEIERYTLNEYLRLRADAVDNGWVFADFGSTVRVGGRPAERIENSYTGYASGVYKADTVVAACMRVRREVFKQARFCWRDLNDNGPGRVFRDSGLGLLEKPWPNGTTGELLTRMITDIDLCGNSYIVNEGDRLRWLRPDWVSIVLSGDPEKDPDVDVKGYIYSPGGKSDEEGIVYLPEDVCHWAPVQDPMAQYRGMSWLTPAIREVQADLAATEHKLMFFKNGATLGPIVKVPAGMTVQQFKEFVRAAEEAHAGAANAYKTMYVGGGADVTLSAATMQQLEFKATQGAGETRIAALSGVGAVLAQLSEGLQGSSLNAGNFNSARRSAADICFWPLWQDVCGALSAFVDAPGDAELWIREKEIPFLREDQHDAAEIQQMQMATMASGITAGYEPDSVRDAVVTGDWKQLVHTGLVSVQLLPPGAQDTSNQPNTPPAIRAEAYVGEPPPFDDDEDMVDWDEQTLAVYAALDELDELDEVERAHFNPAEHPRNPKGTPGGGRFRSLVDRVVDALKDFHAGNGDDPLKDLDREQLRKVAKARGHTLPRGISEEKLRDLIHGDVKGAPKTPEKPKVAPRKAAPDFNADPETLRDTLDLHTVPELKDMLKERGLPVSGRKRDLVDRLVGDGKAATPERAPRKPVTPDQDPLSQDEMLALRDLSTAAAFSEGGWVRSSGTGERDRHLDGLVAKGWIEKHVAPDGTAFYRIPSRGGAKPSAVGDVLEGDVLPAAKRPDSRLALHQINRGAIIDGYRDPGNPSTFSNVPEDGTPDPSRLVRVVVQRLDVVDENGQPTKAVFLGTHRRIIGHDADTGERIESGVVSAGSHWSWFMNPDTATSADIEGELVDPRLAITAPKRGRRKTAQRSDTDEDIEELARALGQDVTPGHDELHHYWTRGEGLAKWADSPKPWTTLVAHLTKYVGLRKAKIFASRWFIEVFHYAAGSDKNRVAHGHPPRGHRVGPG